MTVLGEPAHLARQIIREQGTATLSTVLPPEGWPYGSLVLVATDAAGAPILLISTLAEHTKNIAVDPRLSLLFDGTQGLEERLTGARVTLLGRAERSDAPHLRDR